MNSENGLTKISDDFRVKDTSQEKNMTTSGVTGQERTSFFSNLNPNNNTPPVITGIPSHEYDKLMLENQEIAKKLESVSKLQSQSLAELSKAKTQLDNAREVNKGLREAIKKYESDPEATSLAETYAKVKGENKTLKSVNRDLKVSNADLEEKLEQLAVSSETSMQLQMEYQSLEIAHQQLSVQYEEMRATLNSQLSKAQDEISMLQSSKEQRDGKDNAVLAQLRYEKDVINKQLQELQGSVEQFEKDKNELTDQLNTQTELINTNNEEVLQLKQEIETASAELKEKDEVVSTLQLEVDEMKASNNSQELQNTIDGLKKALEDERVINAELREQIKKLQEDNTMNPQLEIEFKELTTKLKESENKVNDLTNQVNELTKQVEQMKLFHSQFPSLIQSYNSILAEIKKHDKETYDAFETLFKREVLSKPDLVKAILESPE